MELKRIGILSAARMYAAITGFAGCLAGAFIALSGVVSGSLRPEIIGMAIGTPIFYTIFGFIMGAVTAVFYNLAAEAIGGLELEFSKVSDKHKKRRRDEE